MDALALRRLIIANLADDDYIGPPADRKTSWKPRSKLSFRTWRRHPEAGDLQPAERYAWR